MPGPEEASLPQDVDLLQALVRELQASVRSHEERHERQEDRIKQLQRERYGRKSEKASDADAEGKKATPHRKGGRHRLPENLRVRKVILNPPKSATKGMVVIHREVREYLEYDPASIIRVQQIFNVWADPKKKRPPVKARVPVRVIPHAAVGAGLLARLLVAKYRQHLPLARLTSIFEDEGIRLERQKLCRWVTDCAELLRRIFDLLAEKVRAAVYFLVDETPVPVRDPKVRGKTKLGYYWVYLDPKANVVVFDFHMTRHTRAPERFIPRRKVGGMHSDGYKVYARIARSRPMLVPFACWAHARRKINDAKEHGERHAAITDTLKDIGALFEIEERTMKLTDEQRAAVRGKECPAIFARLKAAFEKAKVEKPAKRRFRIAAKYALDRWSDLTRYAAPGFGHVHISTNAVERAIRPVKVGIRNYLFMGNSEAGTRAGVIYSIIETCKLLHVHPQSYLRWVLPKLAAGTNQSTATGLLPHDYAALLEEKRKEQ